MSLYNALFGTNKLAPVLLKMLDIDQQKKGPEWPQDKHGKDWSPWDEGITPEAEKYIQECREKKYYASGRFRDIYLNADGSRIILYTRNGGGNRESYPHIFSILASHPNYITNYDDDFDCTYCYYEFSVPDEYKEDAKNLTILAGGNGGHSERFQQLLKDLESGKDTPEVQNALQVGEKLFDQMKDGEGNKIIEI